MAYPHKEPADSFAQPDKENYRPDPQRDLFAFRYF
jgi:hypothetical protein